MTLDCFFARYITLFISLSLAQWVIHAAFFQDILDTAEHPLI